MGIGKTRRLRRVFAADGRTLIVALDHAAYMPRIVTGLERPATLVADVFAAGADAVMTTLGTIRMLDSTTLACPLIMSVDAGLSSPAAIVEQALRLGIDMLKSMVYLWSEQESASLRNLQALAIAADAWGMPLMAEVFPGGYGAGAEWLTVDRLAAASRVAAEAGADVIKTFFASEAEAYAQVINYSPVPLVVLGGEKSDDPRPLLETTARALEAGAAGVAIGRNIWKHPDPARMTTAIAALVHGGATVEKAISMLA